MLPNGVTRSTLLDVFTNVQAKVKTASICCLVLHDQLPNAKTLEPQTGIFSAHLQLDEAYEQMEGILCLLSEIIKEK